MLSAIAARKAAQAAKQQSGPHNDENEASEIAQVSVTSGSEAATPQKKRKAKGQDVPRKTPPKRAKHVTNAHIGRTRYFEVENPIEYLDDDSPQPNPRGSPSPSLQNSTPERGLVSGFVPEDHGTNRGYSPSRPVLDSSDEDDENSGHEITSTSPGKHLEPNPDVSMKASRHLFVPRLDSNCFRLTSSDIENLDVSLDVGDSTGTLILLPPGHSLTFVGAAYITLLQGSIVILGTPLLPSHQSHRVFSPRSSPLVSIETPDISNAGEYSESSDDSNVTRLPHRMRNAINASDSVVVITPLISGVENLGNICRIFDGVFDVGADVREKDADDAIGVEGFHPVNPQFRSHLQLQPFLMSESWDNALDSATPSPSSSDEISPLSSRSFVALIKGPKKCGKSTFARTLLNRLTTRYRRVAFLECDLGQSEFTPGGMVALNIISEPVFGPPFTHPTIPYQAHYIGHLTPRSSPSHYLACIQALVQTYRMDVQYAYQESDDIPDEDGVQKTLTKQTVNRSGSFIPLVVNTQGWLKGLGGDLLRKIEEIVDASDIFDLETMAATFPPQRNQRIVDPCNTRLHAVRPILSSPLAAYYTPADHRSLSILSYFHSHFPTKGREVRSWSTEIPLCAQEPWEVDCKEAIRHFVLVGAGFEDVVPEELAHAINCGVVALVCDEDTTLETSAAESTNNNSCLYTQGSPVPSPSTSRCLGLALIRGVNATMDKLHLLTPVSPTLFHKCHVLVMGELELPAWGMLDFRQGQNDGIAGIKWGRVPYLQMGDREPAVIGGTRRRVRKNLMRRGQI